MTQLSGTLANYIIRVRRYLNEDDPTVSRWTDDFLKQLFNSQYRKRCAELYMSHEGYFTLIAERSIVADQSRYTWPDGFSRLLRLEVVRSDGRRVPIQRNERHYHTLPATNDGGDSWTPTYRPVGSGFLLEPTPASDITNGLRMEYTGVPEELTADADRLHTDFPGFIDELVVLDCVVAAMDAEGLQETGQIQTILRQREEWQVRWERFIDGRMVSGQGIVPWIPHYLDA